MVCFCEGNEHIKKIHEWLVKTDGKYITIVLDGYGKISESNKSFFINDVLYRKKLIKCGLVIASRPTASSHLYHIANCKAKVLGFTEEDRLVFIQSAFKGEIDKITELDCFLQSNPFLNTLCYAPLNMSILLCLTEDGVDALPKMQANCLKNLLRIMIIVHFLKNRWKSLSNRRCH